METGTPILPVCVLGSGKVLPPGSRLLNPGKVRMILLPPIYPEQLDDTKEMVTALKKKTRAAIHAELLKQKEYSLSSPRTSHHYHPAVSDNTHGKPHNIS